MRLITHWIAEKAARYRSWFDRSDKERERARREAEYLAAERPALAALRRRGVAVGGSLWSGRPSRLSRADAEAIVTELERTTNDRVAEGLVRLLEACQEPFDARGLAERFDRSTSDGLRWAIGYVLARTKPEQIVDWILATMSSPEAGRAREELALAVARHAPRAHALPVLVRAFPEFPGHVAEALGEIGGEPELKLLDGPLPFIEESWVRESIAKAAEQIRRRVLGRSRD